MPFPTGAATTSPIVISRSCKASHHGNPKIRRLLILGTPKQIVSDPFVDRIFTLEKTSNEAHAPQDHDAEASSPLLSSDSNPDPVFRRALDSELEKICSFYQLKELEIFGEVTELLKDEANFDRDAEGLESEQVDGPPGSRGMNKNGHARRGSIFRQWGFGRPRGTSAVSRSLEEVDEDGDSDDDHEETTALHKKDTKERRRTYDASAAQYMDDLRSSRELPNPKRRASQADEDYNEEVFSSIYDSGITLKKRTISLYVSLCELKSFVQLNKTGFTKALKKYDKILDRKLKTKYLEEAVKPAYPFCDATMQQIEEYISNVEKAYANVVCNGDVAQAKRELRLHLREHVVWERNTVWREMIGIERKAQAANMGLRRTLLGGDHDPSKARLQGDDPKEEGTKEFVTPAGRIQCPRWLCNSTFITLVGIIAVFVVLLLVPIMKKPEQQNCLAMLIFVSLLWATEVCLRPEKLRLYD